MFHTKFGEGVIVTLEGSGDDARAQVNFGRHGMKWLALIDRQADAGELTGVSAEAAETAMARRPRPESGTGRVTSCGGTVSSKPLA